MTDAQEETEPHVEALEEENVPRSCCGPVGKYPIASILVFAACGIGLGVGLSYWTPGDPDDANTKKEGRDEDGSVVFRMSPLKPFSLRLFAL